MARSRNETDTRRQPAKNSARLNRQYEFIMSVAAQLRCSDQTPARIRSEIAIAQLAIDLQICRSAERNNRVIDIQPKRPEPQSKIQRLYQKPAGLSIFNVFEDFYRGPVRGWIISNILNCVQTIVARRPKNFEIIPCSELPHFGNTARLGGMIAFNQERSTARLPDDTLVDLFHPKAIFPKTETLGE